MKPEDLRYTKDHEWIENKKDMPVYVGITDYAQHELGDIVYVELPEVGDEFGQGESFGNVESVKAVSPLNMPAGGTVVEINEALEDAPELVNQSPLADGWLVKIELADGGEVESLMELSAYKELLENQ